MYHDGVIHAASLLTPGQLVHVSLLAAQVIHTDPLLLPQESSVRGKTKVQFVHTS